MNKYAIITPVKNEMDFFGKTVESVLRQSILPVQWIIIDDHSNDGTEVLIKDLIEKYPWIECLQANAILNQDYSSRVVHLFNQGKNQLKEKVDFISKLDGDVSFDRDFFKNILKEFQKNPKLGIASGHLTLNGVPEVVRASRFECTRGATKIYRMDCFRDIGGLVAFQGWDTLDNVAARAKGWEVAIVKEYFEHLKKEGSKLGKSAFIQYRTGLYNGAIPYGGIYFLIKALSKVFTKPILIGSLLQMAGYFNARYIKKNKPYPDYIVKQLHAEQKGMLKEMVKK